MNFQEPQSWGRLPATDQKVLHRNWRDEPLPDTPMPLLPFGRGRSYGDSCLNDQGWLIHTEGLNRFLAFDEIQGVIRCEAGVTLEDLLRLIVPRGWFPRVTPGTRYVTLGGAVANDVHGKNHPREGSFGNHLTRLGLLRSDIGYVECSEAEHPDLFQATVGGLGLTGLILWVEFRLKRIEGPWLRQWTTAAPTLERGLERLADSSHEYQVLWLDLACRGRGYGRGVLTEGDHTPETVRRPKPYAPPRALVPFDLPHWVLNPGVIRLHHRWHYHSRRFKPGTTLVDPDTFFYPLDRIRYWNRLYGRRGLRQYQCALPLDGGRALSRMLSRIADSRLRPFLSVLKRFGSMAPRGMLSFPRQGHTLALDFPNIGAPLLALLDQLDEITLEAGGAVYPAKDARMSASAFSRYYPELKRFQRHRDPRFSSSFFRRVAES